MADLGCLLAEVPGGTVLVMGLVQGGEGHDDETGIDLDESGQKLFLDACSVCGTPLTLIGESSTENPVCKACSDL
jgi:hypothetical protein